MRARWDNLCGFARLCARFVNFSGKGMQIKFSASKGVKLIINVLGSVVVSV